MKQMTARQAEVVRLASEGRSPTQIAGLLGLAPSTVSSHLDRAYRKTDPPVSPAQDQALPAVDPVVALIQSAGRRPLACQEVQSLLGLVKALRRSQAEAKRLAARNADYEQVIRSQRAELVRGDAGTRQ